MTLIINHCEFQEMYKRECEWADRGVARMVPKLREVHIIRDSWTSKDNARKKSNLL